MQKVLIFIFCFLFLPFFIYGAEMVDINTATLQQLDTLTGIGPVYAQRIIDGRPYSSLDDLLRVKGIGPATLQKIKDQGLACVNCAQLTQNSETQNPKSETNSNDQNSNTQNTTPTPSTQNLTPATTYPGGIYINEILPNPEGADETDEWFELYNSNSFDVDLSGWQIKDSAGSIATFTISPNTKILSGGYLVFKRPNTKIMLNNDEDGLELLTPDNKSIDNVSYSKAPLGQSYAKTADDWVWTATLTPGSKNILAKPQSVKTASSILPKTEKTANNNIETASLTDGLNIANSQSPWFLFFTVLITTIILAIIVLLIKFRFLKPNT